ncbi:FGGY-family carbohydrate kinase [Aureimonas glaciei]|uniref:Carbohydrate kinase n=1 Tax=Aureimonas glaciei TaxID=1776957 RepID=A0A917D8Y5_9HYPH|nr:FGGY-family carbohydrate kinase [Aureimonas glaciei]GGD10359.1 carbohydrate kinase [Aureimonas glaciei]
MSPEPRAPLAASSAAIPPAPRFVAVIDIGKTNAKLVLHDLEKARDRDVRSIPNRVLTDGPYPHADVEGLSAFILDGLDAFAGAGPLDAISITTHGAACALVDAEGLVLPVLDYEHDLAGPISDDYEALRPDFAETQSPRLPKGLNVGNQLYWLQRRFPSAFGRATHFLTYPQYWAFRLTGVAACEITSLGCHTDLWNPAAGDVSSLVDRLGWRSLFAPMRSAFDVLGSLRPDIAAAIGLAPGRQLPVFCGIHDSNASLLPHLLSREAPFSVVSTGTWIVSFAVGGKPTALDPARDTLVNVDAFARPTPSAMFMGGREFDLLTRGAADEPDDACVAALVARQVMALPGFVPGTGPFPASEGCWSEDPDSLSPAERSAVASLYAALMVDTVLGLIGGDGPTVVEGPFARNGVFLDTLAALTGRPVIASAGVTGTSAGAALLARGSQHERRELSGGQRRGEKTDPALLDYAAVWRRRAASAVSPAATASTFLPPRTSQRPNIG